jgi:hypothetical protein
MRSRVFVEARLYAHQSLRSLIILAHGQRGYDAEIRRLKKELREWDH